MAALSEAETPEGMELHPVNTVTAAKTSAASAAAGPVRKEMLFVFMVLLQKMSLLLETNHSGQAF
jgi:hypothetical protein